MMEIKKVFPALAFLLLAAIVPAGAAQKGRTPKPSSAQTSSAQSSAGSAGATITFRKIFKDSSPEYVKIEVSQSGASTYDIRQIDDTPQPRPFTVSPALAAKIFALAAALDDFNGITLEVRRRVANLGEKTYIYEKDGVTHQVSFNYTSNDKANQLLDIFEGLSLEDQYAGQIRRTMRYDPLGLDNVLTRLQRDIAARLIPEPAALVPLLNEIAANSNFLDIARQRARMIVAGVQRAE